MFCDISFHSKANVWGVGFSKIAKFDLTNWEYFYKGRSTPPNNNSKCLAIDRDDNVFIGTNCQGLYISDENGINPVLTGTRDNK